MGMRGYVVCLRSGSGNNGRSRGLRTTMDLLQLLGGSWRGDGGAQSITQECNMASSLPARDCDIILPLIFQQ